MSDEQQISGRPVTDEVAIAAKDIDIFAGYLGRLENPDPTVLSEGRGRGLKLYDEVARDAHAGSVLQTRALSIARLEWKLIPADDSVKAQAIAEFVKNVLDMTNMTQAIQELMQAVLYGFYVAEVLWTVRRGAWVPARLITKHPRRFVFTPERELRLLTRASMITGEVVPERKFVVFTCGSSDNPYGQGLGQSIWWPVWFKKNGIKFWMQFLDKFGSPTPVGKYPAGSTPEQKNALMDAIEAIHQETGVTIPEGMAIELLEAARSGQASYEAMCEYMDRQISKRVLGQTATTEGTPGKLGNEESQDEVRHDIRNADADLIEECLNSSLVRWLVDLNFPDRLYPWLVLQTEEPDNMEALTLALEKLVPMGLRVEQAEIRDKLGLSDPAEGVEPEMLLGQDKNKIFEYHLAYGLVTPNEVRAMLGMKPVPGGDKLLPQTKSTPGDAAAPQFSEGKFTPEQQALEDLTEQAIAEAAQAFSDNEEKMLAAVRGAHSFEEAQERLLTLLPDLDADRAAAALEQCLVSGRAFGAYTVEGK
ncbi:MAG: DUF935 family protein [Desulfobulbus sp.]|nr:MAG: DUF935 family protein [Desulfobulbus sp.]